MSGVGPKTASTFSVAPPTNYVAGIGRGAQGFTTRSDIGPARPISAPDVGAQPQFGVAPVGYVAGRGRGMGELARDQGELSQKQVQQDQDRGDYSESNYDEFSGYSEKLFTRGTPYEEDDVEADLIYEAIDERMDSRRKRRRELQMLEDMKKNRNNRPKIADQFADLKRELASVTSEQWESIPEVGDHSLKHKQTKRNEVFTPVPDYLIESSQLKTSLANSLDPRAQKFGGFETPMGAGAQSVTGMAEARGTVLSLKLDKMSDSVSGQTVVDPKGYLTDLNSLKITSDAEVGDIKKARTLLGSVTATNPKHGPGWIAAARVEEYAGKLVQARKVIRQGCEACPESEDVWLEAARVHSIDNAKTILANAVRHLPCSVKIWLKAAELETLDSQKKIVLRRALEFVPNSVKLWKTAIELEDVDDARIMLARAVECVPHSVDMWLALAKLETYDNARKVLNQAREAIPTESAIWITASKLEEAHGHGQDMVDRIIEKAIASLRQYQVTIDRDHWIREAEAAEVAGAPMTCAAIIRNTIHIGVDEEDRKRTWMDDAEVCLGRSPPAKETARAIYKHALSIFPGRKSLWLAASALEKEHGTPSSLENILKEAVKYCPQAEVLWLMAAKEKWLAGDVPGARAILVEAFDANPDSEQIWLAAVKLEWENGEFARARILLTKARDRASSERIWMKSALLEREVGDIPAELQLLDQAISKYPTFEKYYMMAGQACDEVLLDFDRAREYFQKGIKQCSHCVALWVLAVRLEEKTKGVNRARSMMERARLILPKNDQIWLESVRLERRTGNIKSAENLMACALQECPTSGLLWAEEVSTCPKPQEKSKSVDALRKCDNDPHVIVAVARLLERDRKYAKARKWFSRAVTLAPDYGDAWIYFFAFELKQGTAEGITNGISPSAEEVLKSCITADPHHGELWCSVSKQTEFRRLDTSSILKKAVERILTQGSLNKTSTDV